MKRTAIVLLASISWIAPSWMGIAAAQQPVDFPATASSAPILPAEPKPVRTVVEAPLRVSPGEAQLSPEARAHEEYLLRQQAAEESVIRAAKERADQRTRRLESRRWFGISNQRPMVSTDPYNGDYGPHWVGNDPGLPYRWVGVGQPWMASPGE